MTEQQISNLKKTLHSSIHVNVYNPDWIEAFTIYNAHNNQMLALSCKKCYPKVLHFIINNPEAKKQ